MDGMLMITRTGDSTGSEFDHANAKWASAGFFNVFFVECCSWQNVMHVHAAVMDGIWLFNVLISRCDLMHGLLHKPYVLCVVS